MCKIAIFLIFLFSGCGMFGPPMIGSGKPISELFAMEAALNPSGRCSFMMLHRSFLEIDKIYYKKISKKEVFKGGLKGLSKELGKELELPEFKKDKEYDSGKLWEMVIEARDNSKNNLSRLCYATVQGMVSNLGDRFSTFVTAEHSNDFVRGVIGGDYVGIGVIFKAFAKPEQRAFVLTVYPNSPAERAGLKDNDELIAVGNTTIKSLNFRAEAKVGFLTKGRAGTPVRLTVKRKGLKKPKVITVVRKKIEYKNVYCRLLGKVVYCQLVSFGEKFMKDFRESFEALPKEHDNKIIIDLRNNLGGLLGSADKFLAYGWFSGHKFIAATIKVRKDFTFLSEPGGKANFKDYKTVVLVNHDSASASEIVAGALQDHGKAVVIGTKTFGKGTVQALMPILGAALNLTIREYWTPLGDIVNKKGINPNMVVNKDIADLAAARDPQLKAALKFLRK
ncbi:PDZ domain-containing protein [Patescibacteria group bacterium]|nr:PDZ domain-containing protein [Patescibacteria group bacterium]